MKGGAIAVAVAGVLSTAPALAQEYGSGKVMLDPLPSRVTTASLSAAVGALSYGEVTAELALRFYPSDVVRVGIWGFGSVAGGNCGCGHIGAYASAEYALRRADNLSVWIGLSFGPMVLLYAGASPGASAMLSLDIALPITRAVSFDLIAAGGFDAMDVRTVTATATGNPNQPFIYTVNEPYVFSAQPLMRLALGVTWDFARRSRPQTP